MEISLPGAPGVPLLNGARAAASRRNGAKSRGPTTPEGKARSSQNALKHGLRAHKHVVLPGEDAAAFRELEAALLEELAPDGTLQSMLAQRVVAATWRLERAERLEAELFAENHLAGRSIGLALIRDCNGGARSFDTLLRYRGGTLAELWRALRTLKALQAERAVQLEPVVPPEPRFPAEPHATPIEPETRGNPGEIARAGGADELDAPRVEQPDADLAPAVGDPASVPQAHPAPRPGNPIEPEPRGNPGQVARRSEDEATQPACPGMLGAAPPPDRFERCRSCRAAGGPEALGTRG